MGSQQAKALPTQRIGPEAFQESAETALWWLTNAGFLVNARGTLLMVDPAISMSKESPGLHETGHTLLIPLPIEASEVPRLDAVLYTHSDYDHLALRTAQLLLERTTARFIGPPTVAGALARAGFPDARLLVSRPRLSFRVGQIEVTATPADHPWQLQDPERFGPAFAPEDCVGYLLETPDGAIWHPGDTRLMPQHLRLRGVDILLLDVSRNEYHLGVRGAAELANTLPAPTIIPHHYGSFDDPDHTAYNGDPAEVAAMVRDGERRFRVLAPGETFVVAEEADER
jgi:L-ascorbate metabolism protein UlaG (beta-lactamase superfamily)